MKKALRLVLLASLFCLTLYPIVAEMWNAHLTSQILGSFETVVEEMNEEQIEQELDAARVYNSKLYAASTQGMSMEDNYDELLNVDGSGLIGRIIIPKIDVDLAIYHGCSEEVLNMAVGHLENTSLPVGGESTRAVLSGHRGLVNAKLFTRLDEIVAGDLFFIEVLDEKLAYEVDDIEIVDPDDVDSIMPVSGQDLVTLVTCTPYGINSHRMLVTGHRIEYTEDLMTSISRGLPSFRESLFFLAPFLIIAGLSIQWMRAWKEKRDEREFEMFSKNVSSPVDLDDPAIPTF